MARAGNRGAEGLDRTPIDLADFLEPREVVNEGGMNDAIRRGGATPQAIQFLDITSMHVGTRGGQRLGCPVGASQAEYPVACPNEFLNHG
jgi:hypothetical protein